MNYNMTFLDYKDEKCMRRMLSALPGSYDDFVESTIRRMQESEGLKDVLFDFLLAYPNSRPSDVIKVLFEYLGMVKPLEIVDDYEETLYAETGNRMRAVH